jgi:hypothetical protein
MPEGIYRVRVSPPWSLLPPPVTDTCATGAQCIINGYSRTPPSYGGFIAITDDPNAPPRNILIEAVGPDATCP